MGSRDCVRGGYTKGRDLDGRWVNPVGKRGGTGVPCFQYCREGAMRGSTRIMDGSV